MKLTLKEKQLVKEYAKSLQSKKLNEARGKLGLYWNLYIERNAELIRLTVSIDKSNAKMDQDLRNRITQELRDAIGGDVYTAGGTYTLVNLTPSSYTEAMKIVKKIEPVVLKYNRMIIK